MDCGEAGEEAVEAVGIGADVGGGVFGVDQPGEGFGGVEIIGVVGERDDGAEDDDAEADHHADAQEGAQDEFHPADLGVDVGREVGGRMLSGSAHRGPYWKMP